MIRAGRPLAHGVLCPPVASSSSPLTLTLTLALLPALLPACDKAEQAKDKAGELSEQAQAMVAKGAAAASGEGVEGLLAKGEQLAPIAADIGKTLRGAVESDFDIEPIVQKLDDPQAQAELDERIKDMPRVETINGFDVGFKDMTRWDSGGRETESAYLILWRRGDRLLGLVYRSRQRIHMDKLVAEAPRLVALVSGAL